MEQVVCNKDLLNVILGKVEVHTLLRSCRLCKKWNAATELVLGSDQTLVCPRAVFQHFVTERVVRNESLFVRLLRKLERGLLGNRQRQGELSNTFVATIRRW
jgi:hypothetical protein